MWNQDLHREQVNILIDDMGRALVADFGLSRILNEAGVNTGLTTTFGCGSYPWMAPELVIEKSPRHSPQTDMWAVGCLLIEVRICAL